MLYAVFGFDNLALTFCVKIMTKDILQLRSEITLKILQNDFSYKNSVWNKKEQTKNDIFLINFCKICKERAIEEWFCEKNSQCLHFWKGNRYDFAW